VSHRYAGQLPKLFHVWKEIQACMHAGSAAYALAISDTGIPDKRLLSMSRRYPIRRSRKPLQCRFYLTEALIV
jgi:hypothetical protein